MEEEPPYVDESQLSLIGIDFPPPKKPVVVRKPGLPKHFLSPQYEFKKTALVSLMRYDFSLAEVKTVTVLMMIAAEQIKEEPDKRNFTATLKEISSTTKLKYRQDKMKEMIYGLQHKPVILNVIEKHGIPKIGMGSLISWAEFEEGKEASFDFSIPDRIRDQLHDPDYFTLIRMIAMQDITSKYTYALYEFCKSYYKLGQTKKLSILELRHFLGLDEGVYENFADLEKRVLLVAKQEMANSEKIEIEIDYVTEKVYRKASSIYFIVTEKSEKKTRIEQNTVLARLMSLIPDYNKTEKTREIVRSWSIKKGEEYCIGNIEYSYATCKKERSFSIYLSKALTENWGADTLEKRKLMVESATQSGQPIRSSSYLNPTKDQEYVEKFESYDEKKQKSIRHEMDKRILAGHIKKFLPKNMQLRLAMEYLESE